MARNVHPGIVSDILRDRKARGIETDDGFFHIEVLNTRGEADMRIDDNGDQVPRSVRDLFDDLRRDEHYDVYFKAPERNGAETPPSNQRGAPQRKYTQEQAAELDQAEYDKAREEGLIEGL